MPITLLVTGASGFLGSRFVEAAQDRFRLVPQRRPSRESLRVAEADAIINFAYDPACRQRDYDPEIDIDRLVAGRAAELGCHYFMLSSRLVYGQGCGERWLETSPPAPQTVYAKNKLATERHLTDELGDKLTILRIGNVFGPELGRATFAGTALSSLRSNGVITMDVSPDTTRDFLPCRAFARVLADLIPQMPAGILNIGSGISTRVGDMAEWFIQGFGAGSVEWKSDTVKDSFCLDTGKLEKLVGTVTDENELREQAIDAGKSIKAE